MALDDRLERRLRPTRGKGRERRVGLRAQHRRGQRPHWAPPEPPPPVGSPPAPGPPKPPPSPPAPVPPGPSPLPGDPLPDEPVPLEVVGDAYATLNDRPSDPSPLGAALADDARATNCPPCVV